MEDGGYLVPGRECGSCTACCVNLAITADGMDKLPGIECRHCVAGGGCAIYQQRPAVCRTFHCLWRSLPTIGDEWRPDRSGILMMLSGDLPAGFEGEFAVDLILVGLPGSLIDDRFAGLVGGFVESGTAIHLNVQSKPGSLSYKMFLNPVLAPAIALRDLAGVKSLLRQAYEALKAKPAVPVSAWPAGRVY